MCVCVFAHNPIIETIITNSTTQVKNEEKESLDIWLQATQLERGEPRSETWRILFQSLP